MCFSIVFSFLEEQLEMVEVVCKKSNKRDFCSTESMSNGNFLITSIQCHHITIRVRSSKTEGITVTLYHTRK